MGYDERMQSCGDRILLLQKRKVGVVVCEFVIFWNNFGQSKKGR